MGALVARQRLSTGHTDRHTAREKVAVCSLVRDLPGPCRAPQVSITADTYTSVLSDGARRRLRGVARRLSVPPGPAQDWRNRVTSG
jgi:hypothetical protein